MVTMQQRSEAAFLPKKRESSQIMRLVIYATLPGLLLQGYFWGLGVAIQLLLTGVTTVGAEYLCLKLRARQPLTALSDCSALLTALLLALCLPPLAPWWIAVVGSLIAILIAKQSYGGLGQNIFNPAMVGYVALLISFPNEMGGWRQPNMSSGARSSLAAASSAIFQAQKIQPVLETYDVSSMATPLERLNTHLATRSAASLAELHGSSKIYALALNSAFLGGGLLLLALGVIQWQIPVGLLSGLFGAVTCGFWLAPDCGSPLFHLGVGSTMLGAFFIATDPVTAATSPRGRLIFGILIGLIIYLIRVHGAYAEGTAFAVLLGNMSAPLIDHFTMPKSYGAPEKK